MQKSTTELVPINTMTVSGQTGMKNRLSYLQNLNSKQISTLNSILGCEQEFRDCHFLGFLEARGGNAWTDFKVVELYVIHADFWKRVEEMLGPRSLQ